MKKSIHAELSALQQEMDALRQAFAADPNTLPRRLALQHAVRELVDDGTLAHVLAAGEHVPELVLPDTAGKPLVLASVLRRGPVILVFYRGDWCPYCRLDLQSMNTMRDEVAARNATLLAISPQTVAANRRTQRMLGLRFTLLSDVSGMATAAFRLPWNVPAAMRQACPGSGGGATLPMASRYVIGRDGVVVYAEINADPRFRGDPAALIPILDILSDKTG
jgi:peroxiredoxin